MSSNIGYRCAVFTTGLSLGLSGFSTLLAAPASDPAVGALTLEPTRPLLRTPRVPTRWERADARRLTAGFSPDPADAIADLLAAHGEENTPVSAFPAASDVAPAPRAAREESGEADPAHAAPVADRAPVLSVADLAVRRDPTFAADMLAAPGRSRLASEAAATWLGERGTLPEGPEFVEPGGMGNTFTSAGPGVSAERVTARAAAERFEAASGIGTGTRPQAAGLQPAAALTPSGVAYAWGYNNNGQLGNGTTAISRVPVAVSSSADGTFTNTGVTAVAAGQAHSLAVQNGAVYAWGYNNDGQLGNNSTANSSLPVAVSPSADGTFTNTGVTAVAAGTSFSLAVQNGAVYAWGYNNNGQLGNNSTANSSLPVAVSPSADGTFTNSGVTAVAAGFNHSLAIQNGAVYAWGSDSYGQVGNGQQANDTVPLAVSSANGFTNTGVTAVAAGGYHSLAVQNGALYAWGYNAYGQLGNGRTAISGIPVAVLGLSTGVTSVAGGYDHSLAVQNGNVFAWGYNNDGQLGNGTTTNSSVPVEVNFGGSVLSGIVQVAAGEYSSYALASDGSLYVWGYAGNGQLGDGGATEQKTPEHLLPPSGEYYQLISSNNDGLFALAILGAYPVPEPGTWAGGALLVAAAGLTLRRRRLRRA